MKIKTVSLPILSVLLTASLLCGCNGESGNSTNSDSGTSSVSEPEESLVYTPSVPENATFLKGALGDPIDLSEITFAMGAEFTEIPPAELSEDNFSRAAASCAYFAYPAYSCRTSLDDSYDADNVIFPGVPQGESGGDYIKVKAGDKIFGLTVKTASSSFDQNARVPGSIVGTFLELDGEVTVTGYAWIEQQDEYGISAGDIKLIPSGDVQLPVARFDSADENGIPKRANGIVGMENGIYYTNDFGGSFSLGNANETTADISALPADGSYAKVTVTVTKIELNSTIDWMTRVNADIVSVEPAG